MLLEIASNIHICRIRWKECKLTSVDLQSSKGFAPVVNSIIKCINRNREAGVLDVWNIVDDATNVIDFFIVAHFFLSWEHDSLSVFHHNWVVLSFCRKWLLAHRLMMSDPHKFLFLRLVLRRLVQLSEHPTSDASESRQVLVVWASRLWVLPGAAATILRVIGLCIVVIEEATLP